MDAKNQNIVKAMESGNGAKVAIAMYESGVDITNNGIYRVMDNTAFRNCAKYLREFPTASKAQVLTAFKVESQCSEYFTEMYDSARAQSLKHADSVKYAIDETEKYRAKLAKQILGGLEPDDSDDDSDEPDESESRLPTPTGKVKPFDSKKSPAIVHEMAQGLTVKVGGLGSAYKVKNWQGTNKVWRVNLLNSTSANTLATHHIGSIVELTDSLGKISYGKFTVTKIFGNGANLSPVTYQDMKTEPTTLPVEPAKTSKGKSAKTEPTTPGIDSALVDAIAAAVLAKLTKG